MNMMTLDLIRQNQKKAWTLTVTPMTCDFNWTLAFQLGLNPHQAHKLKMLYCLI